jgi:fucose 4-O-acetylase-like acetyltransferase
MKNELLIKEYKTFEREHYIDFLKFIGMLMLVLAHVSAPKYILQLRDFDVPLMVFISAILSKKSLDRNHSTNFCVFDYYKKRFYRLIVPTWIFLIIFYIILFLVGQFPDLAVVIRSFLFQRDSSIAGYVWVIWVYFLCSLMTPFLYRVKFKTAAILGVIIFAFYELLCNIPLLVESRIFYYTFFTLIPYGIITLIGLNYERFNRKSKISAIVLVLTTWVLLAIYLFFKQGNFVMTNLFKYPVRTYYILYGLGITSILFEIFSRLDLQCYRLSIVKFVSRSSLWTYLWHILYINFFTYYIKIPDWKIQYFCVLLSSLVTVFIQNKVVDYIESKTKNNMFKFLNVFRG